MAFLKPLINGEGFYFVESETRQDSRMDIVVTYNNKKYIIELKIWHGEKEKDKGVEQLGDYLESQSENEGYLILYSFNKKKSYESNEVVCNGKEIFEIVV